MHGSLDGVFVAGTSLKACFTSALRRGRNVIFGLTTVTLGKEKQAMALATSASVLVFLMMASEFSTRFIAYVKTQ